MFLQKYIYICNTTLKVPILWFFLNKKWYWFKFCWTHQGMVFSERHSIYGKNGAIKYITHLDKFSYFQKHYNFHEIMLYSQYPSENFQVAICVHSQTTWKYSDEMTVSQNNFNCAQKLSIIDMTRSVSCIVCIEIIVFTLFAWNWCKMLVIISFSRDKMFYTEHDFQLILKISSSTWNFMQREYKISVDNDQYFRSNSYRIFF